MAKVFELVDRANSMLFKGRYEKARSLIESALSLDPQNVDAWETFLRICLAQNELDVARSRVLGSMELNRMDEFGFFSTRDYLIRRIESMARGV